MTQPNPELWARFIEAVKDDLFSPIEWGVDGHYLGTSSHVIVPSSLGLHDQDHLCAELRRWMLGKGYSVLLSCGGDLNIGYWYDAVDPVDGQTRQYVEPHSFSDGAELDWHLQAALWVLEREGE